MKHTPSNSSESGSSSMRRCCRRAAWGDCEGQYPSACSCMGGASDDFAAAERGRDLRLRLPGPILIATKADGTSVYANVPTELEGL